ncbi:MAG: hypothetical protein R3261_11320, partial [Alphaproteobacteria bacterium]|nr:hypothetical protein [Alphaproteobacteria bacterium]
GYLMETIAGLAQLAAEMSDWCEDETPENVVLAQQVIDATEMSGRLAYEYIEKINNMAFSMSTSLANWKQTKANIAQIVMKVENILDGWSRMIEMWNSINDDFRHLQRDVVWDIVQNLPVLPAEALNKNQQAIWQGITKQQSLLEKDTGSVSDEMEDEIEGDLSQYRVEGD